MIDLNQIDPEILAQIVQNSQAMTLLATFKWLVNFDQDYAGDEPWGVYATTLDLLDRRAIIRRSTPTEAILAAARLAGTLAGMPSDEQGSGPAGGGCISRRDEEITC